MLRSSGVSCRVGLTLALLLGMGVASPVAAQQTGPVGLPPGALAKSRQAAAAFLRTTQSDDGHWSDYPGPAITGIVTKSLLDSGVEPGDPMIQKALAYLKRALQPDGGIYTKENKVSNYETSVALLAFAAANRDGQYDELIANARDFLKKLQWDETEGLSADDPRYGGGGYGRSERPDLSNTSFLLEALKAAGVPENDESMKKVVIFLSRCQNLESEHNTTEFASKINDGGFYYTPAGGGNSQAGTDANGGLRSYASMTYAGLKSMIYAGVGPDDPRVKAAMEWLKKHYTLAENPGMGQKGLYYYYHTFAKALSVAKVDRMVDAKQVAHDWRKELGEHLVAKQRDNGAWINTDSGWLEGDPNLVTAYALMALKYCETPAANTGRPAGGK